jgi:acyl dehydratase
VDADGAPVSVTDYGSVYLGVACDPEGELPDAPNASGGEPESADPWTAEVPIPATLAHVYTECARIWNPIHTDPAVARRAGLSAILLHGTATLALSISAALAWESRGAETPVARVACRFTGMVSLPSRLTVTGRSARAGDGTAIVTFRATTPDGRAALSDGWLAVGPSDPIPRSPR